jgi:hypothetical protein
MQRPNLPPQQSSQSQVQISGEIGLARRRGRGARTNHEKAARGEYIEMLSHQCPKTALNAVANHRGPNRTADNKAYLRRLSGANTGIQPRTTGIQPRTRRAGDQQMHGQRRTAGTPSLTDRTPKIGGSLHPRLPRQHLRYPGIGTGGDVRR